MFASSRSRWLLGLASASLYATVFALVLLVEEPGLGTGHLFYLAVMLLAMATGPAAGAAGGMLASGLFTVGVLANPSLPSMTLVSFGTAIRLVTFVMVGFAFGLFASRNRAALSKLTELAERDHLTGLLNSRGFEKALSRRIEQGRTFGLLYGDVDSLKQINDTHGHAEGDRVIKQAASLLQSSVRSGDVVARLGGDEFAALVETRTDAEAEQLVRRLEDALRREGAGITLGWALYPAGAVDGYGLVHAADKRLYQRKALRPDRRTLRLAAES
jgi:diguanylate cyclase (GGDEF)-like protein